MDVKMAAAVVGAVRAGEVAEFCRTHGISRQTFYKWRRRWLAEGQTGLEERSRRPLRSPARTSVEVEERIVRARKELEDLGGDGGAWSIRQRLIHDAVVAVPSEATIWRVLVRRGMVVPEPRKRPKVSFRRFEYPRPNDCWQIDATHWALASGRTVEIINIIDDHSRLCVAAVAVSTCTSAGAWDAFVRAGQTWGLPARVLSDNGLTFNGSRRKQTVTFEANLRAAGVCPIASTPSHPQTCGKVERFHQTMKNWLTRHQPARSLVELQAELDRFVTHYNFQRPHRALHGSYPATTWALQPCAVPADQPVTTTTTVTRDVIVTPSGHIRIGNYQVNVGVDYERLTVTAILSGIDCIIFHNNQLVRTLQIDPTKFNQPSGRRTGGTRHPRVKDSHP